MNKEIARIAAELAHMAGTMGSTGTGYIIGNKKVVCMYPEWLKQTSEALVKQAEALLALIEDVEGAR